MVSDIVFLSLSLSVGLSFIILLLLSGQYEDYIKPLNKKDFMLPEIYGVGFLLIKIFKFDFKTRSANIQRENVAILYGERYADYYLRVFYAQRISVTYLLFSIFCAVSALANDTDRIVLLVLAIILCSVVFYYLSTISSERVKKRSIKFMDEFPNAVSTIALLVNSGMVLREAWKEVSTSEDSELYREMRIVNEEMDNGVSEIDALYNFGNRCVTPEIKKFTAFIVQGLEKGSKDLADALRNQANELWLIKKQNTLKRGELASSKLMIPLMIMFIGVLIMIMGPIITNLNI